MFTAAEKILKSYHIYALQTYVLPSISTQIKRDDRHINSHKHHTTTKKKKASYRVFPYQLEITRVFQVIPVAQYNCHIRARVL